MYVIEQSVLGMLLSNDVTHEYAENPVNVSSTGLMGGCLCMAFSW